MSPLPKSQSHPDKRPKVAIVGASGYSGETLLHLLSRHPFVELTTVTSRSLAGKSVAEVLPRLRYTPAADLLFSASEADALAASDVDVVFLALPHGVAATYAVPLVAAGKRVIDLSADFRLSDTARYLEFYGKPHPAPELLAQAAYVIPELHTGWQGKPLIAAPGCYPTSLIVPLYPLIEARVISADNIVANSISGVSGAGKKAEEMYLFVERAESVKAYGIPKHRHLSEIEEQLSVSAGRPVVITFNPHLAPIRRGIASTITARLSQEQTIESLYAVWQKTYSGRPLVTLLPAGQTPDTAHVAMTSRIEMSALHDVRTGNVVITSAEDNLLKGASGQAVQILNLWLGFPEITGLDGLA